MIYLIDDNQGNKRKKVLHIEYIDDGSFDDVLVSIEKLTPEENLDFLQNAACILIHSTTEDWSPKGYFIEGSQNNVNRIINDIADHGDKIPLVIFSNQMPEKAVFHPKETPNIIQQIKKNVFYRNVKAFLENYRKTGEVNLHIIAYEKKHKNRLQFLIENISESMKKEHPRDIFKTNFIGINILREFHHEANLSIPFDDFINNFEDKPITNNVFQHKISIINESNNEYGENIYDWPD